MKISLIVLTLLWSAFASAGDTNCNVEKLENTTKHLYSRADAAWCLEGQDTASHVAELMKWMVEGKATFHSGQMLESPEKYTAHLLAGYQIVNYVMLKVGDDRFAVVEMEAKDKTRSVWKAGATYKIDPSISYWSFQVVDK